MNAPTEPKRAVSFFDSLLDFTNFSGRASVSEYRRFTITTYLLCFIPFLIFVVSYAYILKQRGQDSPDFGPIPFVFFLPLPFLFPAIAVRRLHDIGLSGLWLFLVFGLGIGFVILLLILERPSMKGPNRYGPEPWVYSYLTLTPSE